MNNKSKVGEVLGVLMCITLVLSILKILGVIAISWVWVLLPLWAFLGAILVIFILATSILLAIDAVAVKYLSLFINTKKENAPKV